VGVLVGVFVRVGSTLFDKLLLGLIVKLSEGVTVGTTDKEIELVSEIVALIVGVLEGVGDFERQPGGRAVVVSPD